MVDRTGNGVANLRVDPGAAGVVAVIPGKVKSEIKRQKSSLPPRGGSVVERRL